MVILLSFLFYNIHFLSIDSREHKMPLWLSNSLKNKVLSAYTKGSSQLKGLEMTVQFIVTTSKSSMEK
jgi:hypothetical protein